MKFVNIPLILLLQHQVSAFAPINTHQRLSIRGTETAISQNLNLYNNHLHGTRRKQTTDLFFFRKLFNGQKDNDNEKDGDGDSKEELKDINVSTTTVTESTTETSEVSQVMTNNGDSSPSTPPPPPPKVTLSPLEQAKKLRLQADRTRLEAEKMDIQLTLEKMEKLEKELTSKAITNPKEENKAKAQARKEDIQALIKQLKKKFEPEISSGSGSTEASTTAAPSSTATMGKDLNSILGEVVQETKAAKQQKDEQKPQVILSSDELEASIQRFNTAPKFMQELVVKAAGMSMEGLNTTELMLKVYKDEKEYDAIINVGGQNDATGTATASSSPTPEFTQDQIDEVLTAVKLVPQFVKNLYGDDVKNNDTAIALIMLEEEWREGRLVVMPEITQKMIDEKLEEIQWVPAFLKGSNDTELAVELIKSDLRRNTGAAPGSEKVDNEESSSTSSPSISQLFSASSSESNKDTNDSSSNNGTSSLFGGFGANEEKSDTENMVESIFPESTRKEGNEITDAQAKMVMTDVLAKDSTWIASGPPQKVPGGFIIRGSTRYETGKELIEVIDKNLAASRVRDQVTVFYVFDPTPVTEAQMDMGERPPVLFVTNPDVCRDAAPIQRSLISSVAFGTVWYTSLLPFLLNPKYMKLAEEQVALADASMSSNMDFLNDLSFPLFAATLGIQGVHEVAHIIAAGANGVNITFPTLAPSLVTGLMGGITSLKSPPKDKQALFDFAIAGPLAAIAVSISLIFAGMAAANTLDAAAFAELPAIPLQLLRSSSLGGGIIDSVSPGLLTVPDAALSPEALSEINIPLHPLAIAGYFGLLINAVNLLPVGRTDGGRIALALFGRTGMQVVSIIAFIGMFIEGLMGSDILLFFFSYVIFFQSELEVPQRNEVDDMEFSRVLLATATGVLVLLTLIPM